MPSSLPVTGIAALIAARDIAGDARWTSFDPTAQRRKKLLVADMDSPSSMSNVSTKLADMAGLKPQIAAITEAGDAAASWNSNPPCASGWGC